MSSCSVPPVATTADLAHRVAPVVLRLSCIRERGHVCSQRTAMSTIGLGYERNGLQLYIYQHIHVYIYIYVCTKQITQIKIIKLIGLMNRKDDIIIFIGSQRDDYRNRLLL